MSAQLSYIETQLADTTNNLMVFNKMILLNPADQLNHLELLEHLLADAQTSTEDKVAIKAAKHNLLMVALVQNNITSNVINYPSFATAGVTNVSTQSVAKTDPDTKEIAVVVVEGKMQKVAEEVTEQVIHTVEPLVKKLPFSLEEYTQIDKLEEQYPEELKSINYDILKTIKTLKGVENALQAVKANYTPNLLFNIYYSLILANNLEGITPKLKESINSLIGRFTNIVLVERKKEVKPQKSAKPEIVRITRKEWLAEIQRLNDEGRPWDILTYAKAEAKSKGLIDVNGKVLNPWSDEVIVNEIKSILPEYDPTCKCPWVATTRDLVPVIDTEYLKVIPNYTDAIFYFKSRIAQLSTTTDIEQAKANIKATAMELFGKHQLDLLTIDMSEKPYKQEKSRRMKENDVEALLWMLFDGDHYKWAASMNVDKIVDVIVEETTLVGEEHVVETVKATLESNNIPTQPSVVANLVKNVKNIFKNRKAEVSKEAETVKAVVYMPFKVSELNPDLFNKHNKVLTHAKFEAACKSILVETDWVTSLNYAKEMMTKSKFFNASNLDDKGIEFWFNATILGKQTIESNTEFDTETVNKIEALADKTAITITEVSAEVVKDTPDAKVIATNPIKTEKQLREHCIKLIQDCKVLEADDAMRSFASWVKNPDEFFVAKLKKYQDQAIAQSNKK